MDGRVRLALNLRQLRTARDLSQEQLAVDSKVAAPYVSRIERGTVNPTIAVLDRLAATLGVGVDRLLREVPPGSVVPSAPLRSGRKSPKAAKAAPPVD